MSPLHNYFSVSIRYVAYTADENGNVKAQAPNRVVDSDLLCEILSWNKEGISVDDVIEQLRV